MNDIKKSKNISGEAYIQSSNANARVCLTFQFFWLAFIILGELVLDVYMPHMKGFGVSYSVINTNLSIGPLYKVPTLPTPFLFRDVIADIAHWNFIEMCRCASIRSLQCNTVHPSVDMMLCD